MSDRTFPVTPAVRHWLYSNGHPLQSTQIRGIYPTLEDVVGEGSTPQTIETPAGKFTAWVNVSGNVVAVELSGQGFFKLLNPEKLLEKKLSQQLAAV